ncbi:MAG TPA: pyruvate kinase [Acidimicrobiia bacterium]|nr:pyruvate kinase [Acidimicrobiia bacterium]
MAIMQRQTKIIATLGPAVASQEGIRSLVDAGMDVARLNFSHGGHELHRKSYEWVRSAAEDCGRTIAIMQDIQGPKLRVGEFPGGAIELHADDEVDLLPDAGVGDSEHIPIGYEALLSDVSPGDRVILDDGLVSCEVVGRTDTALRARVVVGGILTDHKGVAFPDSSLTVGNITPKDEVDLAFGRELGVDFVAASFVRSAADVEAVASLAGEAPIIAKIELAQALDNLDEIIKVSFGVMVARGDLGVQLPLDRIPLIQADILKRANAAACVSVTATEMLESMTHHMRPTRAEVTDVATAVMEGTDAVMLSGETAIGDYPSQTVRAMARICQTIEEGTLAGETPVPFFVGENDVASAVAQAATQIAKNVGARTIVAFTESGSTARLISKYRPGQRVVAFTPNVTTRRRMAMLWGIQPHAFERRDYTDAELAAAARILEEEGIAATGETVVMVAGVPPNFQASTNLVKVHQIGEESGTLGG